MLHENDDLISVLMPAYNAAEHLLQSVQSVLNQSYKRFELIIVDDGSHDNTLEVANNLAAEDQRVKVFSKHNAGWPAARNYGLELSKGALIALLDADDTWHPTFLEKMYGALFEQPENSIAYCGWQNLGVSEGRGKPYVPPDYEGPDKLLNLLQGCPWPIHAILMRRNLMECSGGFNEKLTSTADYDLWLRIAVDNKIVRVPEVLAYYHHRGSGQITANHALIAINQHKIQRAFLAANPNLLQLVGRRQARELIGKQLLNRGFDCYWNREMPAARKIFRQAMRFGYGTYRQWVYMLPSLLTLQLHTTILNMADRKTSDETR